MAARKVLLGARTQYGRLFQLAGDDVDQFARHHDHFSDRQAFGETQHVFVDPGGRFNVFAAGACWHVELAAALNGGRAHACSDEHFGRMSNILNPGRGINMGDGWETARRRTPGNDWVIVALGHAGEVEKIIVDTLHFKGNYPDSCSIQGAFVKGGTDSQIETQSLFWRELLPSC